MSPQRMSNPRRPESSLAVDFFFGTVTCKVHFLSFINYFICYLFLYNHLIWFGEINKYKI